MIINGDCLEVMPSIPDKSIDMILCDLPYGTTACAWDTVIPFGPLWEQYKRLIKDNGVIALTASQPFTTDLINSNRGWFKYTWVWEKTTSTGFLDAKNKPLKIHEDIVIFSNGVATHGRVSKNRMTYNPQKLKGEAYCKTSSLNCTGIYGKHKAAVTDNIDGSRYPNSIIKIPNGNNGRLHPTQKPIALFEYLIRTYTNPGDTVMDNCAGSGTTGVACYNADRKCILIKKDPVYFELMKKRLDEVKQQRKLFEAVA